MTKCEEVTQRSGAACFHLERCGTRWGLFFLKDVDTECKYSTYAESRLATIKGRVVMKCGNLCVACPLPSCHTHAAGAVITSAESQLHHHIFLWKPEAEDHLLREQTRWNGRLEKKSSNVRTTKTSAPSSVREEKEDIRDDYRQTIVNLKSRNGNKEQQSAMPAVVISSHFTWKTLRWSSKDVKCSCWRENSLVGSQLNICCAHHQRHQ